MSKNVLRTFETEIRKTLRGRRKIDLITLNVKLTLRGRGGGVSHGFGIEVKKKMRKNE